MRLQSHQSLCGPASVANALRALGVRTASEDKVLLALKRSAGANDPHPEQDGTSAASLQRALQAQHMDGLSVTLNDWDVALAWLRDGLLRGHVSLLAVDWEGDQATHWVTAIGLMGARILVADSADPEIVLSLSERELQARWRSDTDPARCSALLLRSGPRKKRSK